MTNQLAYSKSQLRQPWLETDSIAAGFPAKQTLLDIEHVADKRIQVAPLDGLTM